MLYLITKSGHLSLQKTLFFFRAHHFRFVFCDFIKLGKNTRYLWGSSAAPKKKFLVEVEITLKCYSSRFGRQSEDLMFETLFQSLFSRHYAHPDDVGSDEDQSSLRRYAKRHLEMVFLFQVSEWTSKFVTHRIILTRQDLCSRPHQICSRSAKWPRWSDRRRACGPSRATGECSFNRCSNASSPKSGSSPRSPTTN